MIHLDFTLQQAWNYASPAVGALAGKLVEQFFKNRKERKEKKKADPVVEALRHNVRVDVQLDALLQEYEADRISIMQFHNGGNLYPSGQSMTKFSITYEATKSGVPGQREKYQNIPVSIFSKAINYVSENDVLVVPDTKRITYAEADRLGIGKNREDKSVYVFAIKTIDNKLTGLMTFSYVKKKRELTQELINELQLKAASFGAELLVIK